MFVNHKKSSFILHATLKKVDKLSIILHIYLIKQILIKLKKKKDHVLYYLILITIIF